MLTPFDAVTKFGKVGRYTEEKDFKGLAAYPTSEDHRVGIGIALS